MRRGGCCLVAAGATRWRSAIQARKLNYNFRPTLPSALNLAIMSGPYNAEGSSSGLSTAQTMASEPADIPAEGRWKIAIPSNFLILPPAAATLGLVIGMTRGGRIARLRFLAENVHRQPTTYQGWVSWHGLVARAGGSRLIPVLLQQDEKLQDVLPGLPFGRQVRSRLGGSNVRFRVPRGVYGVSAGRSTGQIRRKGRSGGCEPENHLAQGRSGVVGWSSGGYNSWNGCWVDV